MPGSVALKAPIQFARCALHFHVVFFQSQLPGQLVFRDEAAARTRLLVAILHVVESEAVVLTQKIAVLPYQPNDLFIGKGLVTLLARAFDVELWTIPSVTDKRTICLKQSLQTYLEQHGRAKTWAESVMQTIHSPLPAR